MKKINLFFVFGMYAFFLIQASCNGSLNQNPLNDQPKNVQEGIPPENKVREDRSAVPRDALRLEIEPELPTFTEGLEGQILIKADLLQNNKDEVMVEVKNLPEGAKFDSVTRKLTWTPSPDAVKGSHSQEIIPLTIQMSTIKAPITSIERTFQIYVHRNMVRPEIVKVIVPSFIQENSLSQIQVMVRDLDSVSGSYVNLSTPKLAIVSIDNATNDGSALVRLAASSNGMTNPHQLKKTDPNYEPALWIFELIVDTRYKELTSGRDLYTLGAIAYSQFGIASADGGVPSAPKKVILPIFTKIPSPITTWSDEFIVPFKEGQQGVFTFDVYAPSGMLGFRSVAIGDGRLDPIEIKSNCDNNLPGSAQCQCVEVKSWRYQCQVIWTPPIQFNNTTMKAPAGIRPVGSFPFSIAFRAINRNPQVLTDTESIEFVRRVSIVK